MTKGYHHLKLEDSCQMVLLTILILDKMCTVLEPVYVPRIETTGSSWGDHFFPD